LDDVRLLLDQDTAILVDTRLDTDSESMALAEQLGRAPRPRLRILIGGRELWPLDQYRARDLRSGFENRVKAAIISPAANVPRSEPAAEGRYLLPPKSPPRFSGSANPGGGVDGR
jgi:hypothetical protein